MRRSLETDLKQWIDSGPRMPVLLTGARQVGKTYLVRELGQKYFKNLVEVNFELNPEFAQAFIGLDPQEINNTLQIMTRQKIVAGETLVFFDEIQECPKAITALRYYQEKMPNLHVIGAGSLLEFSFRDENFSMPVGRILSYYLKPMSFKEFIYALDYSDLISAIESVGIKEKLNPAVCALAEKLLRLYFVVGGMPGVINSYLKTNDLSQVSMLQNSLLVSFRNDFGKYANITQHKFLLKRQD